MPESAESASAVLALLQKHGWNATSFQILEPGLRYWFDADRACVAYVDTGGAWVAAGAPICATGQLSRAANDFIAAARQAGRRAVFFAVEPRFLEATGMPSQQVGEQPVWTPRSWPEVVLESKSLREQLRRARAKGVEVRAVSAAELAEGMPLRAQAEALITRWLATRPMAPLGFLVTIHPFEHAGERRFFAAEREGSLVAFLACIPVYARRGWFLEDFLRSPAAPNGTIELLVDHAMRSLAAEGAEYATLGLAPLAGEVGQWLGAVRAASRELYDFRGLYAFKAKLHPDRWEPIHLAHPTSGPMTAVIDVLAAFSRGGLLRFGLESLLRVPAVVVRTLGLLLIPWTILLAVAGEGWFPSRTVQLAWVAFDMVLAIGLWSLSRRWRDWLGKLLAGAITADAIVTMLEAALYNVPRTSTILEALVLVIACAAPSVAAFLLWRAVLDRAAWHQVMP